MGTGAKPTRIHSAVQDLHCVASFPGLQLAALTATVSSFDRKGAVIHVYRGDLRGRTIRVQDSVLLEVGLPSSSRFGRRAMRCTGKATHVSESSDGTLWLTVRFQQLHFQQVGPSFLEDGSSVPQ